MMGVSGCGKTTIGRAWADRLGCPFYDGDDFHPAQNVAKMATGIPLSDADRKPWLDRLAELIADHLDKGETAVVACSALKKSYRERLRVSDQVQFIYLKGDFDLIWERMQQRKNHYMKAEMLQSQFDVLEPPDATDAIIIPVDRSVEECVAMIARATKDAAQGLNRF
jgi:carbohydrate kinase (thermoresistant glucokinase family)